MKILSMLYTSKCIGGENMKKEYNIENETNVDVRRNTNKEMRKNKKYLFVFGMIIIVVVFFSILYQRSYDRKMAKSKNGVNDVLSKTEGNISQNDAIITESQMADKVMPDTEYILETYNISTGEGFSENLSIPPEFVGLNRVEVLSYLNAYMIEMPLEEYEKGLLSCELVSFSDKTIVLKKSYNSDAILYKYYIVVEDNVVVVYYCDKKTVYEYTGINAADLDMEERMRLSKGIEVETEEELYSILENYSS